MRDKELVQPLHCSSSSPVLTEMFFHLSKYSRKFARVYYFALPTHRCNSDLSWHRDYVPLHVISVSCIHSLSPLSPPVHSHACALWRLPVHGCRFPQRRAGKLPRGFRAALTGVPCPEDGNLLIARFILQLSGLSLLLRPLIFVSEETLRG